MLNKLCRNFGIYEDICRNVIRPSKEEYHRNSRANQKTIASNEKVRICQSLPFNVIQVLSAFSHILYILYLQSL